MSQRCVVITGASSGIGREIALRASSDGCRVVIAARREALLLKVAAECLEAGASTAVPVPCDVADAEACKRLLEACGEGEIVLVNNAGWAKFGDFAESDLSLQTAQIQINLLGTMYATHALLPEMLSRGAGQILNVLSVSSTHTFKGSAAYCAAKAGALAFTRVISQEVRSKGVRVMALLPGPTDTEIWGYQSWQPDHGRMMTAEAVAEVAWTMINSEPRVALDEVVLLPSVGLS